MVNAIKILRLVIRKKLDRLKKRNSLLQIRSFRIFIASTTGQTLGNSRNKIWFGDYENIFLLLPFLQRDL